MLVLLLALGCNPTVVDVGDFTITLDQKTGSMDVTHEVHGEVLEGLVFTAGTGSAEIEMNLGSYAFEDIEEDLVDAGGFGKIYSRVDPVLITIEDASGTSLGTLTALDTGSNLLTLSWAPDEATNRVGFAADCDEDDHFLGMGAHAMDVDHVGQAFPLWVSEPGVGKTETEELPGDWFSTGTRHASSFPVPLISRPHRGQALRLDTSGRIDMDLCASDPGRFSSIAWQEGPLAVSVIAGDDPIDVLRTVSDLDGRPVLPPPWVFAPWNDAIRGEERVLAVADRLREYGAPSSVIWTEDWKGGEDTGFGYHLTPEWRLDEELYPNAHEVAQTLEDRGFKWFGYFAPFVVSETDTWEEAVAANALILDEDGEPYTFIGVPSFEETSLVDLSSQAGRAFAIEHMQAALEIGFDGWMADYAEWLPVDAKLASGQDALEAHNIYPRWWQETNLEATYEYDASFFVRSGWSGTAALAPVVWAGDQRTDFQTDDGLPTVVAMGIGLGASGVPIYTHDIAGYQSLGNDPSTKELWFRWAALGAFTPVMRTHHGAFEPENWQFDSDDETTEYWTEMAREHMRLFPYRYGLAARASNEGVPMILPPAYYYGGDYGRLDAWMLGEALLVAPVLEEGVSGRDVELPPESAWYDWFTHDTVESGWFDAEMDEIPVFVAADTTVPTFGTIPDTLTGMSTDPDVVDLEEADGERIVYVFGNGGEFVEADGTRYTPSGSASIADSATAAMIDGQLTVGDLTLTIDGDVSRIYTLIVVP